MSSPSPSGLKILIRALAVIQLYSCMQRGTAAPDDILQMHQTLASNSGWGKGDKPLGHLSFRLSRLRAAATSTFMFPSEQSDDAKILEAAMAMDQELDDWSRNIPESRKYTVVNNSYPSKEEEERHEYPSVWAAQTWNNYRALRILVRQLIVSRCNEPGERDAHVAVIQRLSRQICVSAGCYKAPSEYSCSTVLHF